MVTRLGAPWGPLTHPETIIGGQALTDYKVGIDVFIEDPAGEAGLYGRYTAIQEDVYGFSISRFYELNLNKNGIWNLNYGEWKDWSGKTIITTLASGIIKDYNPEFDTWRKQKSCKALIFKTLQDLLLF